MGKKRKKKVRMFSNILINLLSETQLGRLFGVFIQRRGGAGVREGGGAGTTWLHPGVHVRVRAFSGAACLRTPYSICKK